ncbi:MAG: hypothetical protein HKN74_11485 [Acidimicrobiia bacterium]|nr:hypothetical protein [Acidimicrobiia bacterium]MBT8216932.1 hypothetical protein [Acidimicrobiia bacterium]NNF10898.1 hypothetical protein [Acidimicrobiia bacterium]NNL69573.1 hypothetical protein [Acidimicrobiia bacterium]
MTTTRRIGLSLGADLCWPTFYEDIVGRLDPVVTVDGEEIRFDVERVTIEPYSLRDPARYDVVLDRLTHWYHTSREWIKKSIVMDGTYVLNNPFTIQAMEKHTSYAAMMRLGLPVPDTWMLPPKHYVPTADLQITLESYARMFDLPAIGRELGYPLFLKPFDGGAWVGVSRIESDGDLERAYDESGTRLMHLQKAAEPFDLFVRALAIGPQVNVIRYDPAAPIHDRYKVDFDFVDGEEWQLLSDMVLTINTFFGWDFNSCESLRVDGEFRPIDFANPCPDSQVTSLHFHIPWLVKSKIRWSLFCAATKRPMHLNPDWGEFFAVADRDLPYREKLAEYGRIARRRLDTDRFEEFCADNLADLDAIALEYFGTDRARDTVRAKVATLFPAHEVDQFADHFWGLLQFWRHTES